MSNAQRWLLRTVNCDVNKRIKATWCHYIKKILMGAWMDDIFRWSVKILLIAQVEGEKEGTHTQTDYTLHRFWRKKMSTAWCQKRIPRNKVWKRPNFFPISTNKLSEGVWKKLFQSLLLKWFLLWDVTGLTISVDSPLCTLNLNYYSKGRIWITYC